MPQALATADMCVLRADADKEQVKLALEGGDARWKALSAEERAPYVEQALGALQYHTGAGTSGSCARNSTPTSPASMLLAFRANLSQPRIALSLPLLTL